MCPGCPNLVVWLGRDGHLPISIPLESTPSSQQSSSRLCLGWDGDGVEAAAAKGGHGMVLSTVLKHCPGLPGSPAGCFQPCTIKYTQTARAAPEMLQTPSCHGEALPQHSQYGASGVPTTPMAVSLAQPRRAGRCPRLWQGHSPGMTPPGFPGLPLCPAPRGCCRAIPAELIMDNGTAIHPAAARLCSLIYRLRRPLRCHRGRQRAGTSGEMPRNAFRKPRLPLGFPRTPKLSAPAESSDVRGEGNAEPGAAQHLQLAAPAMRQPRTKAISAMQGVPGRLANC